MPFLELFVTILGIYSWVVIIAIVLSWGVQLNIFNYNNPQFRGIYDFFVRITDPAFRKIRQFVRPINGIDLAPLVLLLLIYFIRSSLAYYLAPVLRENGW